MREIALAMGLLASAAFAQETPTAAATRFLRAFEHSDFATVRSLLADDATVIRTSLSPKGSPQNQRSSGAAWVQEAETNHAYLRDLKLDLLESSELRIDGGAVVNLRYRFSGLVGPAGKTAFMSDGIDTYILIPAQAGWKILQYNYIERLEMPRGPGGER
ncbi:MAG: nuclear transport factor 2 family protein [Acidobacteriota bacterium]